MKGKAMSRYFVKKPNILTLVLSICLLMVEKSSSNPTKCTTMRQQNVEFCAMVRDMSCVGNGYISDICKKELKIGIIKTQMYDYVMSCKYGYHSIG